MQCQHPYIVFKDIASREMELLLNYMYQGEVNVLQEMLPSLIKAAEALRIKGLAVPDDMPSTKESSFSKRRNSSSTEHPQPKKKLEEWRKNSSDLNTQAKNSDSQEFPSVETTASNTPNSLKIFSSFDHLVEDNEPLRIKEEPPESVDFTDPSSDLTDGSISVAACIPPFFSSPDDSKTCLKEEETMAPQELYEEQGAAWSNFTSGDAMQSLPPTEITSQEDIMRMSQRSEASASRLHFQIESTVHPERGDDDDTLCRRGPKFKHCLYCSCATRNATHLKEHMTYKHTKDRRFPCSFCPKRFVNRSELTIHMRVHTGEKPFECTRCLKRFRQKIHLKVHTATVHSSH